MKTIKFKFSVKTKNNGFEVTDVIYLNFTDEATDDEIEKEAEEALTDWMWNNIETDAERIN